VRSQAHKSWLGSAGAQPGSVLPFQLCHSQLPGTAACSSLPAVSAATPRQRHHVMRSSTVRASGNRSPLLRSPQSTTSSRHYEYPSSPEDCDPIRPLHALSSCLYTPPSPESPAVEAGGGRVTTSTRPPPAPCVWGGCGTAITAIKRVKRVTGCMAVGLAATTRCAAIRGATLSGTLATAVPGYVSEPVSGGGRMFGCSCRASSGSAAQTHSPTQSSCPRRKSAGPAYAGSPRLIGNPGRRMLRGQRIRPTRPDLTVTTPRFVPI
jgi:hypothetical protein